MRKLLTVATTLAVTVGTAACGRETGRRAAPDCPAGWSVVPSPDGDGAENVLRSVTAASPEEAWAAGSYLGDEGRKALLLRWDGEAWSRTDPPPSGAPRDSLETVAARAPDEVWAGGSRTRTARAETWTIRFDGQRWVTEPSPNPGPGNNFVEDIALPRNGGPWAVGEYQIGQSYRTMTLRWTGSEWRRVPSPTPEHHQARVAFLETAAGTGRGLYAAGYYYEDFEAAFFRTLILRWDGREWRIVPGLDAPGNIAGLTSTGETVWAVGQALAITRGARGNLIARSVGEGWVRMKGLDLHTTGNYLRDAVAVSPREVWAVGSSSDRGTPKPLILRWNGDAWNAVPVPGPRSGALHSVASDGSGSLWAAGTYTDENGIEHTLVLRRCSSSSES